jgi:class 3 adenylate cyclase/predicted ATPase
MTWLLLAITAKSLFQAIDLSHAVWIILPFGVAGSQMPQHVPSAQFAGTAERRQVTALAYDLVGSTRLAERLDPEDMHELLQSFHRMCTAAIEEFGGKVNRYVGDGGMAYFGYPTTYENAAERAIQAGLAITERCARLAPSEYGGRITLSVRVGIATSKVVAGDMTGDRGFGTDEVVGIAPHLAARLQGAAEPNGVLVSDATRRLVGTMFRFGTRHELQLSGFSQPQQAWRVLRARRQQTRFEGFHSRGGIPFLGREAELAAVFERWQRVQSGQGQTILLTGDPGIGKSRVVAEIRAHLAHDVALVFSFQCSPLHVSTPLYPVKASLERALLMRTERPLHLSKRRLNRLLDLAVPPMPEAASVLMGILFPHQDQKDDARASENAEQLKEETFATLIEIVERVIVRGPLLIIVEDVQWIDPSSLELLDRLVSRIVDLPVLLIATARPTFTALQPSEPRHLTKIELLPLEEAAAAALVRHVAGSSPISPEELQRVVERSEGNPFFLEELTRTFLDRAATEDREPGSLRPGELPTSLMDVLAARLDQSGSGKPIAQVASAIGRRFPYGLLQQATQLDDEALNSGLARLCELGVIAPEHDVPQRSYSFRHALLQQCAYDSMVKATRQGIHRRLAGVLETDIAEPEILARHLIEAGMPRDAIGQLRLAGQRAALRSANMEAVSLLQRALSLIREFELGAEHNETELDICLALGPLLISSVGPGADEVQELYRRTIALSDHIPADPRRFTAYWGWWRTAPNFTGMRERADQLSAIVSNLADPHLALQAHHCQWATLFMLGEQERCCEHVKEGLALYDAAEHRHDAILYGGHDPKVCGLGEQALSLWLQGFSWRSQAAMKACARHAATLDHLASKTHFEEAEINLLHFRRDAGAVKNRAARMRHFAEDLGFRDIAAKAEIFGGWAEALSGNLAEGIASIEHGLATQRIIGTQEDFPAYLEMLAEAYGLAGEFSHGLAVIDEAIAIANETGLRYWIAELLRRKGDLLSSLHRSEEALRCYDEAIAAAETQNANALVLRAAVSRAAMFADAGHKGAGIPQLEAALARIPEATPTREKGLATELLSRLR